MKRLVGVLVAVVLALVLAACAGDAQPRTEPFVGQWESTGGEQIAMTVDAPVNGEYQVKIAGARSISH